MAWCEANDCDCIFGFPGNSGLDARVPEDAETMLPRHAASKSDKVRAGIIEHAARIRIHLPTSCPQRNLLAQMAASFVSTAPS
jgi:hypothetical protein